MKGRERQLFIRNHRQNNSRVAVSSERTPGNIQKAEDNFKINFLFTTRYVSKVWNIMTLSSEDSIAAGRQGFWFLWPSSHPAVEPSPCPYVWPQRPPHTQADRAQWPCATGVMSRKSCTKNLPIKRLSFFPYMTKINEPFKMMICVSFFILRLD